MATAFVSLTSLDGIATVGALPPGLPHLNLPSLRLRDVDGILPLSCACFLLAYIEGVSAARTLAAKNDYAIDPRQELFALGAANLAVAFGQGFPVAGGLSQSAVNDSAGARTPLALVICSATLGLCLLFFTGLLTNLPKAVLAAIVFAAVYKLRLAEGSSSTVEWVSTDADGRIVVTTEEPADSPWQRFRTWLQSLFVEERLL